MGKSLVVRQANSVVKSSVQQITDLQDFFIYDENFLFLSDLTEHLRQVSQHPMLQDKELVIPDGCERFGLLEGHYKLSGFLHFIADMIEP